MLDVGCGTGYGTWLLGTLAEEVAGIDKSVDAIAEARRDFSGVFLNMDIESAPKHQPNWCFDTIVAFEVMEHLDDVDLGMEAIKSLLSDSGKALISLPLHQPSTWHKCRDYGYAEWREIVDRHFTVDTVYHQPLENERGENVCILPAGYRVNDEFVEDWQECRLRGEADTGLVIFVLEKRS